MKYRANFETHQPKNWDVPEDQYAQEMKSTIESQSLGEMKVEDIECRNPVAGIYQFLITIDFKEKIRSMGRAPFREYLYALLKSSGEPVQSLSINIQEGVRPTMEIQQHHWGARPNSLRSAFARYREEQLGRTNQI